MMDTAAPRSTLPAAPVFPSPNPPWPFPPSPPASLAPPSALREGIPPLVLAATTLMPG